MGLRNAVYWQSWAVSSVLVLALSSLLLTRTLKVIPDWLEEDLEPILDTHRGSFPQKEMQIRKVNKTARR